MSIPGYSYKGSSVSVIYHFSFEFGSSGQGYVVTLLTPRPEINRKKYKLMSTNLVTL